MQFIVLVGGVACGKSTVAGYLHKLGAAVIDGDKIAHEVLMIPEIVDQMVMRWGDRISWGLPTEPAFRQQIAQIVFNEPEELDFLETILWLPVMNKMDDTIDFYRHKYTKAIVIDFPLFVESEMAFGGRYGHYFNGARYWYVDCSPEQRFANFHARRKLDKLQNGEPYGKAETVEEAKKTFIAREGRQWMHKKREMAHVIIDNDMTLAVEEQVKRAWNNLMGQ